LSGCIENRCEPRQHDNVKRRENKKRRRVICVEFLFRGGQKIRKTNAHLRDDAENWDVEHHKWEKTLFVRSIVRVYYICTCVLLTTDWTFLDGVYYPYLPILFVIFTVVGIRSMIYNTVGLFVSVSILLVIIHYYYYYFYHHHHHHHHHRLYRIFARVSRG